MAKLTPEEQVLKSRVERLISKTTNVQLTKARPSIDGGSEIEQMAQEAVIRLEVFEKILARYPRAKPWFAKEKKNLEMVFATAVQTRAIREKRAEFGGRTKRKSKKKYRRGRR